MPEPALHIEPVGRLLAAVPVEPASQQPGACPHCTDASRELDGLSDLVNAVIDRVAPEIPGLPTDPDRLLDRVVAVTAAVHRRALHDGDLQHLSPNRRRTVLAARVGIALAFPAR